MPVTSQSLPACGGGILIQPSDCRGEGIGRSRVFVGGKVRGEVRGRMGEDGERSEGCRIDRPIDRLDNIRFRVTK